MSAAINVVRDISHNATVSFRLVPSSSIFTARRAYPMAAFGSRSSAYQTGHRDVHKSIGVLLDHGARR
jgi:anthranilate phosphoribosyltransferase